jgi:hypothetical protein
VKSLGDMLGRIATTTCRKRREVLIDPINVVGQIKKLGDIFVADIAVGNQTDAQLWGRLALRDVAGKLPDLLFGAADQRAHRAGGVDDEHHINLWALHRHCLGRRGDQYGLRFFDGRWRLVGQ